MSIFCYIEDDEKTKYYVKLTIDALKNNKNILSVDNEIQAIELNQHCKLSSTSDQDRLMCEWITKNAESFRVYLNTIKLISLILICENKDIDSISKEEFENMRLKINSYSKLLDNIYV